ncbi:MAG: CDP-diacylglycerol--glycerol-3-phosphate 3-phosphatidyltransferase [Spirochaetaceae bacterium]|jgi:CDP-diacylglycerol--glycerol-3-phosphate 3-phosphatidyltransferase|nr:CDP-diacylglycerol--glycerol-3-phosphate 3-phosphatidyltransferase [Spirochaetaceae bacterium]
MKLADKFTWLRGFLAPVFFVVYFIPEWTGLFGRVSVFVMIPLLAVAEITDYFDGYFARKYNEVSDFGKLFDPFCDVLLNLTVLLCLTLSGYFPAIALLLIMYREFVINFVRLMAAQKRVAIGARKGGKTKTVTYIVTGFYTLFLESCKRLRFTLPPFTTAVVIALSVLCVILAYASLTDYLISFRDVVFGKKENTSPTGN